MERGRSFLEELAARRNTLNHAETTEKNLIDMIGKNNNDGQLGLPSNLGFEDHEDAVEYFETPADFLTKATTIAEAIKNAQYCCVYTGAGISTGAGANLPDYRGSEGVWTLLDKGEKPKKGLDIVSAKPTYAHMALYALMKAGYIKHIISTNVDGLHLRSGIPNENLSELHGNGFLEYCPKCLKQYLRDFDVGTDRGFCPSTHLTARTCEDCNINFHDNIVNFGEQLPEGHFTTAEKHSNKCTLSLVLGTSLRVSPSNRLPFYNSNGDVIICNLQKTPYDGKAKEVIRAYTDDLLYIITNYLGVTVPTVSPSGVAIEKYEHQVDAIYPIKREAMNRQIEEHRIKIKKTISDTVIKIKKKGVCKLDKLENQTKIIDQTSDAEVILITKCNNCSFQIVSPSIKVIIENSQNCIVHFQGNIITNMMEIIASSSLQVTLSVPVLTITIDQSKDTTLSFSKKSFMKLVVSNQTDNLIIRHKEGDITHNVILPELKEDVDKRLAQFLTRFVNDQLLTEYMVRTGEGQFFTTERELKIIEEENEKAEQYATEMVKNMIKFEKK